MPEPWEYTGTKDNIPGYIEWWIEKRGSRLAPYFVAFVLCLGLMAGMIGDMQDEPEFVTYDTVIGCDTLDLATAQPGMCGIREPYVTAEAYNGFSNTR